MKPPDEQRPIVPPAAPSSEWPYSEVGFRLRELQPEDATQELRGLTDGQKSLEALFTKITEQTGRFLVVINSGGVMVCLGVVTALVSSGKPVIQVLPGALFFVFGLALCGFEIMRMGMRLEGEVKSSLEAVVRVVRNEMTTPQAVQAALHRRMTLGEKPSVPFFLGAFICFICGALALIVGLAWPELMPLLVRFWHFLSSLI